MKAKTIEAPTLGDLRLFMARLDYLELLEKSHPCRGLAMDGDAEACARVVTWLSNLGPNLGQDVPPKPAKP